jgi:ABC-type sugar transport system ATPase subunit
MSREPSWEVRDLVKTFPGVRALDRVSLRLRAGEVHALVGENGSGKSTLAKCLAGTYQPDDGVILHRERPVELRDPGAARKLGVAIFYQELSLVPALTVAENVCLDELAGRGGAVSWRRLRREAREALERLDVAVDVNRTAGDLSIAEQQLVEIARAISNRDVSVLILDEPTAALGPEEVGRLHRVVRRFAEHAAVLYISHRLEEVLSVADVVTVLRDGRVVGERRAAASSSHEIAQLMIGAQLEDYFARDEEAVAQEPLLEARGLRTVALPTPMNFVVRPGEVLGLGGLIGSGRTQIARAICGVDRLVGGELLLEGRRLRLRSPADAIAAGIALVPEDRKADSLFVNLSVPQNISIARLEGVSRGPFLHLGREWSQARGIARLLKLAPGTEQRQLSYLSGGMQQKVVLGRWLFAEAKVLALDEPTQGIDVGAKREVYGLIDELTSRGVGVVMASSDYPELLSISDRVAVVCGRRIVHTANRGELSQRDLIELASSGAVARASA